MTGREHRIELDAETFAAIVSGAKRHDLRKGDFQIGETIRYLEVDGKTGRRTLRHAVVTVTYITSSETPCALSDRGLAPDLNILSIALVE